MKSPRSSTPRARRATPWKSSRRTRTRKAKSSAPATAARRRSSIPRPQPLPQPRRRNHPSPNPRSRPPSFRTEQADFFFRFRSCESVWLRREESLFLFALHAGGWVDPRSVKTSWVGGWQAPNPLMEKGVPHPFGVWLIKGCALLPLPLGPLSHGKQTTYISIDNTYPRGIMALLLGHGLPVPLLYAPPPLRPFCLVASSSPGAHALVSQFALSLFSLTYNNQIL